MSPTTFLPPSLSLSTSAPLLLLILQTLSSLVRSSLLSPHRSSSVILLPVISPLFLLQCISCSFPPYLSLSPAFPLTSFPHDYSSPLSLPSPFTLFVISPLSLSISLLRLLTALLILSLSSLSISSVLFPPCLLFYPCHQHLFNSTSFCSRLTCLSYHPSSGNSPLHAFPH